MDKELNGQAGLEQAAGYTPMPEPQASPSESSYGGDETGIRAAADELTKQRDDESRAPLTPGELGEVVERDYRDSSTGEPWSDKAVISRDRAAADITEQRDHEAAISRAQLDQELGARVDEFRASTVGTEAPAKPEISEPQIDVQPEAAPQAPTATAEIDPELSALLQNPKVRQAVEAEIAQKTEAPTIAAKQYAEATAAAAHMAWASTLAVFPELRGLNGQQLEGAIAAINQGNPQRAQEIAAHLNGVRQIYGQAVQAQGVVQQQAQAKYQQEWTSFANKEDAKFLQSHPEMADAKVAREITDGAAEYLRGLGFSNQDLQRSWNGEASVSLRDNRIQALIHDGMKFRAAQNIKPAIKPVPQVVRPGVAQQRGADQDIRIAELSKRLEHTGNPRDAAELLIAQRAARR
jgi:hypothetical protein